MPPLSAGLGRLADRFSPFRIGVQIAAMASALVGFTVFVLTLETLHLANTAIVEHEEVDLRDETNLIAYQLGVEYARLRQAAEAAAGRLAAGESMKDVRATVVGRPATGAVALTVEPADGETSAVAYVPPAREARGGEFVWYGLTTVPLPGESGRRVRVKGRLDALTQRDLSARHLTFVFDAGGAAIAGPKGWEPEIAVPPAIDAAHADLVESYKGKAATPEDERDRRVGVWRKDVPLPGYDFRYATTAPLRNAAGGKAVPRDDVIDVRGDLMRRFPRATIGVTRGDASRILVRAWDEPELRTIRQAVAEAFPAVRLTWETKDVFCDNFLVCVTRAVFDPSRPEGFIDLAEAAAEQEIESDVRSDFASVKWLAVLLAAVAAAVAFGASKAITLPLERVIRSTERLARGEAALDLPTDARGEIGTLARQFRDMADQIAERNRALEDREARMRAIVGGAAEGILVLDAAGVVLSGNDAADRIFGLDEGGTVGRPVRDLIDRPEGTETAALPPQGTAETTARHAAGHRFPVEIAVAEVAHGTDGLAGPPLYVAIVRDITARKRAESEIRQLNSDLQRLNADLDNRVRRRTADLERVVADLEVARDEAIRADRAKSAFLANMSHELRTPLNAIIGFAELLIEEAEDAGDAGPVPDLKKIMDAGRHLLVLINDVLDLSKIEAEKLTLHNEAIDVGRLVEGVAETVRPLAAGRGNRLVVDSPEPLGEIVGDVTRVRQILLNLLSNACKFTRDGEVTLAVRRAAVGPPGGDGDHADGPPADGMLFEVRDSGIGITPEQMDRLFRPFSQADSSTTKKYGGTGLGLFISKRLCERMGGRIEADSAPDRGSTFRVLLPAAPPSPDRPAAVEPAARPLRTTTAEPPADAPLALVIDDDPAVRELMLRHLHREGFRVITAPGGKEGLELARQVQPAFITLDVMMPETDGWSVLSDLKNDPVTRDIPVVMLTMIDDRDLGFSLGAADFLTKPIDRERLLDLVGRFRHDPARPILVVEDDCDAREVLRRSLTGSGYSVLEAADGQEALEKLDAADPSLILLDLMMPVMDGFRFLDALRTRPERNNVPVIVVTAKELTPADRDRLNGRVLHILQKGTYRRDELLRDVRELLNRAGRDAYPGTTGAAAEGAAEDE